MIKVIVAGGKFSAKFKTLEEAEEWVAKKHPDKEVEYIDSTLSERENKVEVASKKIDHILCKTDWLFVSDVKIDKKHRKIYVEYREFLRQARKGWQNIDHRVFIEEFDNWSRRNYPELFMEGGSGPKMVKKFNYYL
jgi:hypothetical protein